MTTQQQDKFAQDVVDEFKSFNDGAISNDGTIIDELILYHVVRKALTNYGLHE